MGREKNVLREEFYKNFNIEYVYKDLIELVDNLDTTKKVLDNYIKKQFNDNFMYGEIYDIFKIYFNKKDLKEFLEGLGYDFIDLDNLTDNEKNNYY